MSKKLKEILKKAEPTTKVSQGDEKFISKHEVQVTSDANGNDDEVFKASNVKTYDRNVHHHGHDAAESEKVYEDIEQLDEISQAKLSRYALKAHKYEAYSRGMKNDNPTVIDYADKRHQGVRLAIKKLAGRTKVPASKGGKEEYNEETEIDEAMVYESILPIKTSWTKKHSDGVVYSGKKQPLEHGQKVKLKDSGEIGHVSYVHRDGGKDEHHLYKVDDAANRQKRLRGDSFVHHDNLQPLKEESEDPLPVQEDQIPANVNNIGDLITHLNQKAKIERRQKNFIGQHSVPRSYPVSETEPDKKFVVPGKDKWSDYYIKNKMKKESVEIQEDKTEKEIKKAYKAAAKKGPDHDDVGKHLKKAAKSEKEKLKEETLEEAEKKKPWVVKAREFFKKKQSETQGKQLHNLAQKKRKLYAKEEVELKEGFSHKIYDRNEDRNMHSENVVYLAKHFGSKEDHAEALDILKKHHEAGELTPDLSKRRKVLHDKLWPLAQKHKSVDKELNKSGAKNKKLYHKMLESVDGRDEAAEQIDDLLDHVHKPVREHAQKAKDTFHTDPDASMEHLNQANKVAAEHKKAVELIKLERSLRGNAQGLQAFGKVSDPSQPASDIPNLMKMHQMFKDAHAKDLEAYKKLKKEETELNEVSSKKLVEIGKGASQKLSAHSYQSALSPKKYDQHKGKEAKAYRVVQGALNRLGGFMVDKEGKMKSYTTDEKKKK